MEKITPIRKLGYCELVYNHELELGNHLLFYLTRFNAGNFDLFTRLDKIEKAVIKWANLNPFLRARIVDVQEPNSNHSSKYFALPSSLDSKKMFSNVRFYSLKTPDGQSKPTEEDLRTCMDLFYEREFNIEPINPRTADHLWRLTFLKLDDDSSDYAVILHIHNAITDGKNSFVIL